MKRNLERSTILLLFRFCKENICEFLKSMSELNALELDVFDYLLKSRWKKTRTKNNG